MLDHFVIGKSLEQDLDELEHYMRKMKQIGTFGWSIHEMRQSIEQMMRMMEQTVEQARNKVDQILVESEVEQHDKISNSVL